MKIAQIGWAGNANQGDERMFYCIKRYFKKHEIVRFRNLLEAIQSIELVNSCDYVLIGGGGLIFRGFSRYVEFIKSIKKPLGCIGISIEADNLNPDMEAGLSLLKKKCDFIYVRDQKSKKLLQNHYKVIVGPDLSFLYPFKQIKINI